jgi:hypothetical protein
MKRAPTYTGKWFELNEINTRQYLDRRQREIVRKPSEFLESRLKGGTLIDIGTGGHSALSDDLEKRADTMPLFALKASCRKYVAVDPEWEINHDYNARGMEMELRKVDALTHLKTQADNSGVVVANGLFTEPFHEAYSGLGGGDNLEMQAYVKNLIEEIKRVTPNVFFGRGIHQKARDWILEAEFEELAPYGLSSARLIFEEEQPMNDDGFFIFKKPKGKGN